MSSAVTSSWECDTCSDRNPSDQLKCLACETLRPSKRNNSGTIFCVFTYFKHIFLPLRSMVDVMAQ